jgi:hypothetical protein
MAVCIVRVLGHRLHQVFGRLAEPIVPNRPAELIEAHRGFAEPIGEAETIARYIGKLVVELCTSLEARVLGAKRLDLVFGRVDAHQHWQVIECDRDDIDILKFMKLDVLALGMLTCMKRSFDLLAEHKGVTLDLSTIPAEDPRTFAMIRKADTLGVF